MDDMRVFSRYKITEIKKKSSIPPLKEARVGDIIYFEISLSATGHSRHGCHATDLKIRNERTGSEHLTTLNCFDYVRKYYYEWEEV